MVRGGQVVQWWGMRRQAAASASVARRAWGSNEGIVLLCFGCSGSVAGGGSTATRTVPVARGKRPVAAPWNHWSITTRYALARTGGAVVGGHKRSVGQRRELVRVVVALKPVVAFVWIER